MDQCKIAESELRLGPQGGEENVWNSNRKTKDFKCLRAEDQCKIAESELKMGLSVGRRMYGIPTGNPRISNVCERWISSRSQKLNLDWASVWRRECMEFQQGNKGFQVSVSGGSARDRRK